MGTGQLLNMAAHENESRSLKSYIDEYIETAHTRCLNLAIQHRLHSGFDELAHPPPEKKTKKQIDEQAAQQIAFEAAPRHFGPNLPANSSSLLPYPSVSSLNLSDWLTSKPRDANLSDDDISSSSDESSFWERKKRKNKQKN